MKVGFDIGGVMSKFPDVFRPLVDALLASDVEVFVVSDVKPHAKAVAFCHDNGFAIPPERILCADYEAHGELCKAFVCEREGIDLLIDDHAGYLALPGSPLVRLLVMPDPYLPYYATAEAPGDPHWRTDGSEGNFGRRNPSQSKRPQER